MFVQKYTVYDATQYNLLIRCNILMSWHDLSKVHVVGIGLVKTCYKEHYVANIDVLIAYLNFKYDVQRFQLIRIREK